MTVMKAAQLVEKAKAVANSATVYKLGTFGNKTSNGKRQWDCSGLLKGILWGYPDSGKYQSNNVPDQNADTIISKCSGVSTDFSNLLLGEIVWMKGHMGIYVGNGKVIEATPKWDNGVQITTCGNIASGSKSRKWTKHGKNPYIDYGSAVVVPTPQPTPQPTSYKVKVNTQSGVNCRNTPNGTKVKAYANGTVLTISKEQDGWGYTGEGWVSLQYCARIQNAAQQAVSKLGTYEVTASDLIVRDAPDGKPVGHSRLSTDGKKHDKDKDGALDCGTRVTIMEIRDGWGKCPSGWISMKYLRKV